MKAIKIKGKVIEMDFEQCYCQFAPLRNKMVYKYRHMPMEHADIIQEVDISFFKAYQHYNNTKFEFMTLFYQIIQDDFSKKIRRYRAVKRQSNVDNIYLNEIAQSADNPSELIELLVQEDNFVEDLYCKLAFDRATKKVKREDKVKALNLLRLGYKQQEIAEILGCSQNKISLIKREFKTLLREEMCS